MTFNGISEMIMHAKLHRLVLCRYHSQTSGELRLSALLSRNELLLMMGYTKKCEYTYAFDMSSEVS